MKYFKKIINVEQLFEKFFDKDKSKLEITPYKNWVILLLSFIVVVMVSSFVSFYVFINIDNGEVPIVAKAKDSVKTLTIKELDTAILIFEKKEIKLLHCVYVQMAITQTQ